MAMKWIAIKDELPEIPDYMEREDFLITDGNEPGREATFHQDRTWSWDDAGLDPIQYKVVYWMPLPEPPGCLGVD